MIALIDYGAGNLASVRKGFAAAGAELFTPDAPDALGGASGIVVPGVGHFAATRLLQHEWMDAIRSAIGAGTPLLGICLGLQWLFTGSAEAPAVPGLAALHGMCVRLPASGFKTRLAGPVREQPHRLLAPKSTWTGDGAAAAGGAPRSRPPALGFETSSSESIKVPHVGWNSLHVLGSSRLLEGVADGTFAYFTHSFAAPVTSECVATSHHGADFAAAVERGNIFGVQFHPEKSGDAGIRMLRNFAGLAR